MPISLVFCRVDHDSLQIKHMITIDEVQEHLEQFHKYSGYSMAVCPFHDDHSPSMMIWDKGFKCKSSSCGAHGSLEKLYTKVSGVVLPQQKFYNPSAMVWDKWEQKFGDLPHIAQTAHQALRFYPEDMKYLQDRKIDGFLVDGYFGHLDGYFTFPIRDFTGKIVGIVARASPSIQSKTIRYTVSHDCPQRFYFPYPKKFVEEMEVYLPFGTIDTWSLEALGYTSFTGISGQDLRPEVFSEIMKVIYIIPDRGENNAAIRLQNGLGWRGKMLNLEYPDDCKDINDVHKKHGLEVLKELIEKEKAKYNYD